MECLRGETHAPVAVPGYDLARGVGLRFQAGGGVMLKGAWRSGSEISGGDPNPDAADIGYWFHADRVTIGSQDCAWEWPIRVSGRDIDMWSDDPAYPFRDVGIWERRGDRLWICWGVRDSGERPTALASTPSDGWQLVVLEPADEPEPS